MPARRIIIAPEAMKDLNDIWDYVSGRAGTTIASGLIADILDTIDRLADSPGMGHERLDVGDPSYRFLTSSLM
jgi:plasmid stabilization system protein ParE